MGFSAQMFNIKARGKLLGAKKFLDAKFKIEKVTKGKFAWKEFDRELEKEDYVYCNKFTSHIA